MNPKKETASIAKSDSIRDCGVASIDKWEVIALGMHGEQKVKQSIPNVDAKTDAAHDRLLQLTLVSGIRGD